eukprot:SAG31_NODE_1382_length_8579_cov_25.152830_1_plen_55_part_00
MYHRYIRVLDPGTAVYIDILKHYYKVRHTVNSKVPLAFARSMTMVILLLTKNAV